MQQTACLLQSVCRRLTRPRRPWRLTLQARLWPQVAAYAAARMPGCYAAVARVLDELRLRLPDFAPASMLDFGAGPGTAVWAAREACLIWHALMRCARVDWGRRSNA